MIPPNVAAMVLLVVVTLSRTFFRARNHNGKMVLNNRTPSYERYSKQEDDADKGPNSL